MTTEEKVRESIKTTLVIQNPESLHHAVNKIMSIIEDEKRDSYLQGLNTQTKAAR